MTQCCCPDPPDFGCQCVQELPILYASFFGFPHAFANRVYCLYNKGCQNVTPYPGAPLLATVWEANTTSNPGLGIQNIHRVYAYLFVKPSDPDILVLQVYDNYYGVQGLDNSPGTYLMFESEFDRNIYDCDDIEVKYARAGSWSIEVSRRASSVDGLPGDDCLKECLICTSGTLPSTVRVNISGVLSGNCNCSDWNAVHTGFTFEPDYFTNNAYIACRWTYWMYQDDLNNELCVTNSGTLIASYIYNKGIFLRATIDGFHLGIGYKIGRRIIATGARSHVSETGGSGWVSLCVPNTIDNPGLPDFASPCKSGDDCSKFIDKLFYANGPPPADYCDWTNAVITLTTN